MSIKYCALLFIIQIGIISLNAQTIETTKRFAPSEYKSVNIDITKQNIIYKYEFVSNKKENRKNTSYTTLQIGGKYSKFSDLFTLKRDSLEQAFSQLDGVGAAELNLLLPVRSRIGFKKNIIKNFDNNLLVIQGEVYNKKYQYEEILNDFEWKLTNETKTILDYTVRKAQINYGGRNWVAWYAEEIPINLGPYVFGNLPGLILEIYDDKNNFHFLCEGIDNKQKEIYLRVENNILKTTKQQFYKAEKNYHNRPELFVKGQVLGGVEYKKIPYNPIEIVD